MGDGGGVEIMGDEAYTIWICPLCREKAQRKEPITAYFDKRSHYFKCEHLTVKRSG